mgnify:CR=1 FL=1
MGGLVVVVAEMNHAAKLLVAQRLNRVEFCRLAGGVVAEEEPDGECEEQRDHNRAERWEHEVAHERRADHARHRAEHHADEPTDRKSVV